MSATNTSTEVILYLPERGPVVPTMTGKRINQFLLVKSFLLSDGTQMLQRAKGTYDVVLTVSTDPTMATLTIQSTLRFAHATPNTYGDHPVRDRSHMYSMKRAGATGTIPVLEIENLADILGTGIRTNLVVTLASQNRNDGALVPFVARQLLDLAILRHEQCPITVEDYAIGHTAVLPCGHLFARSALEECFRSDDGTCPACRAKGRPTYV